PPTALPMIYPLSLHDALPISVTLCSQQKSSLFWITLWLERITAFNSAGRHKGHLRGGSFHKVRQLPRVRAQVRVPDSMERSRGRSEEHTSELQSLAYLVCRLL